MLNISRRSFLAGSLATASNCLSLKAWGERASMFGPAAAIIDASVDTSGSISLLERAGVEVVARYLSRGCQPKKNLMGKRIAFNPPRSEAEECGSNKIAQRQPEHERLREKFALLSIYQFESNSPQKFVEGLPDAQPRIKKMIRAGVDPILAAARVEAELDAAAALVQSKRIQQPDLAPIFFGVDFDMTSSGQVQSLDGNYTVDASKALMGCRWYFEVLKREMGDRLGVYGNGFINRTLRTDDLVKFSWISESRSFEETAKVLRDGFRKGGKKEEWHLFQHVINTKWADRDPESKIPPLELDANVHNPTYDYFGAWKDGKLWYPNLDRSRTIIESLSIANRNAPIFNTLSGNRSCGVRNSAGQLDPFARYHRSVRVHGKEKTSDGTEWLHVDVDHDGVPEGFCLASDFQHGIKQMPPYVAKEKNDETGVCPKI